MKNLLRSHRAVHLCAFLLLVHSVLAQNETVLYSFAGTPTDGSYPMAGLVFDKSGAGYGTTTTGGTYNQGTVFKLTPGNPWIETVLDNFQGTTDGAVPYAGVIIDRTGALYGATVGGGTGTCLYQNISGCGVIFKLTPPGNAGGTWIQSVLHTFTGGTDGGDPVASLVLDASGNLYGTTIRGGSFNAGVAFKLALNGGIWKETVIHTFGGTGDGYGPGSSLLLDKEGNLWGTTTSGGQYIYCGTVFRLRPSKTQPGHWLETVLYSFTCGIDGNIPGAALVRDKVGNFYSTTISGGVTGNGTVFELSPPVAGNGMWTGTVLYSFLASGDGALPEAALTLDSAGNLYGTTNGAGRGSGGVVFKLSPPISGGGTWTESVLYSFSSGADGGLPESTLSYGPGGSLYGTTRVGGTAFLGTVFKIQP